jgi:hypothetical protein
VSVDNEQVASALLRADLEEDDFSVLQVTTFLFDI